MRAFRVAYDGRSYRGFQRQPSVPTVEDVILDALVALGVVGDGNEAGDGEVDGGGDGGADSGVGGEVDGGGDGGADSGVGGEVDGGGDGQDAAGIRETPPGYAAAGRTDAGVSAVAQTVAFEAPDWLTPAALNSALPGDVRAWASAPAPDGFHATRDAVAREYVYHLHAPAAETDDERARAALASIEGTHDFHNLTAAGGGDTVRTVERATAERDGDYLLVTLRADGFLHELVRRVVSLVRSVARGKGESGAVGRGDAGLERVERALGDEQLSGPEGVAPAPAHPLVLDDVAYPALAFAVDEQAAASARAVFEDLRVERATGARVAGTVVEGVDGPVERRER